MYRYTLLENINNIEEICKTISNSSLKKKRPTFMNYESNPLITKSDIFNIVKKCDLNFGECMYIVPKDDSKVKAAANLNVNFNLDSTQLALPLIPSDFLDSSELHSLAMVNLQSFYKELFGYVEIDIYNWINFTCDFLLNIDETDSKYTFSYIENAITYWASQEIPILSQNKDTDYQSSFERNKKHLSRPFNKMIKPKNKSLNILSLCPQFCLFIYTNPLSVLWKRTCPSEAFDKFLLRNFLEIESYNFTDSEYYIFEQLTNINSVIVLAYFLNSALKGDFLNILMKSERPAKLHNEIEDLIKNVASSPLIYSKSIILKKLFEEASKVFDIASELRHMIRYVNEQFMKINEIFTISNNCVLGAPEKFAEYYLEVIQRNDKKADPSSKDTIEAIKELNSNHIKKLTSQKDYSMFSRNKLIKDQEISVPFFGIKKTHTGIGYANVYIQKLFIKHLIANNPNLDLIKNKRKIVIPIKKHQNGAIVDKPKMVLKIRKPQSS